MAKKSPLGCAEKGVGLDIGGASTGTDAAGLIFDKEFADEGFTKAVGRDQLCQICGV